LNSTKKSVTIFIFILILLLGFPHLVYADPADNAIKITEGKIENLSDKFELSVEAYNKAREDYKAVQDRIVNTRTEIEQRNQKIDTLKMNFESYALTLYKGERFALLASLLHVDNFEGFFQAFQSLQYINERDSKLVENLKIEQKYLITAEKALQKEEKEAEDYLEQMRANKIIIESQLEEQQNKLANLKYYDSIDVYSESNSPVVLIALQQLGKPYQWGAAGPNSFDCSGLTMYCYRQVGIYLSHYSGAQINSGPRVSRSNLQPGDLVFFGFPIHHVAMYIGGGQVVHAPVPGDVVRVVPLSSIPNYAGACRPAR